MTREDLIQEQNKILAEIKSELDSNRGLSSRMETLDQAFTEVKSALEALDRKLSASQPQEPEKKHDTIDDIYNTIVNDQGFLSQQKRYFKERKNLDFVFDNAINPIAQKNSIGITYGQGNTRTVPADVRTQLSRYDYPNMILPPLRPLSVLDVLPKVVTDKDYIEFVKETAFTNNAATVIEGAAKPGSSTTTAVSRAMMTTLAHHVTAPLQLLSDVGRFEQYLKNRLVWGLRIECEDQYLYGTGVDPDMAGLVLNAGQEQNQLGNNRIETIRKAMTKLETAYYGRPTAMILHPNDVEFLDLMKGTDGHYLWVDMGRNSGELPYGNIFRVPIVSTTAINEGTGLMGQFDMACTLFQREGVSVRLSFDHDDNFVKNLVTILVECRETLVLEQANALVKINFGNY